MSIHMKKLFALLLSFSLLMNMNPFISKGKKKVPKLSKSSITIQKGKSARISIKNLAKKAKVKPSVPKKAKKLIKLSYSKKSKKLKITGKRIGTVKIKIRIRQSGKTYQRKLKVRIKKQNKKINKKISPPAPTKLPLPTPVKSSSPTPPETSATPSATTPSSPTPSATPGRTPNPNEDYQGDEAMPIKDIYKKYFTVGAAINGNSVSTMALQHKGMTDILKKHFNSTVLSNLMKPVFLLDQDASMASADGMPVCKFDTCDPALQFCQENNIPMRGHTLIWHNQTPSWFFYQDYDTSKKLVDAATMEKRMESYIRQVLTHCQENYPGVVYCWDVVNECVCVDANSYIVTKGGWKLRASTLSDNDFTHDTAISNYWYTVMGEDYVEKAFTFARKYASPEVKLFYNDYNVFQTEKMNNIYTMVNELKQKGIIDGIGLQPTVGISYPELNSDNPGSFKCCLQKYAELNLEIQITELSFKTSSNAGAENLKKQADRYQEFMQLLLDEDKDNGGPCNITNVTVFGICDDYPLYLDNKQNLYLWNKFCEPKPCFYSFIQPGMDILNKQ